VENKRDDRGISLLSLMQYVISNLNIIMQQSLIGYNIDESMLIKQINYYCRHESRRDRLNFYQKLRKLS
jgi:hypothetical protein